MPRLVALKEFRYGGEMRKPGGTAFEASDKDAKLLKAIKKAADAPVAAPAYATAAMKSPEPDETVEQPMQPRRRYTRRDLRAEE